MTTLQANARKGRPPEVRPEATRRKLNFDIPAELHADLVKIASEQQCSLRFLMQQMLQRGADGWNRNQG